MTMPEHVSTVERKPKTHEEIASTLQQHIVRAMNRDAGDLTEDRQYLFNRYYGRKYGSEKEGYSQFRTREVLEAVEWIMPTLVRAFLGSSRAVVFEATSATDEAQAEQETDVVNYGVLRANGGDGFEAIHNFIKDAVMYPNAYMKVYLEEESQSVIEHIGGVLAMDLPALLDNPDIEILEQHSEQIQVPVPDSPPPPQPGSPPPPPPQPGSPEMAGAGQPEAGASPQPDPTALMQMPLPTNMQPAPPQMPMMEVFELKFRQKRKVRRLRLECVPGEEVLIDRRLTTVNLDKAEFICHRRSELVADLVAQGFDEDQVLSSGTIGDTEGDQWLTELVNRMFREDESPDEMLAESNDPALQKVWVYECYARLDVNGDGTAPMHRVLMVGDTVLDVEETSYQPLVSMSSLLVPHKHSGLSIAELVVDIQHLMTVLTRQLLDNVYRLNVRKKIISQDSMLDSGVTIDNMLNTMSEWIMVRGPAHEAMQQEQVTSILGDILPLIQHTQQSTSMRTGISPETVVDPATLQQSTFGAFSAALDKASERSELVTRCMAETGIKQIFRKVHTLYRMHPDIATTVKLRGEWVPIDTREWSERTNVRTNVGLGHHSRQTMVMLVSTFLDKQMALLPAGLTDLRRVHNALDKYVEALGLGDVGTYFVDPADEQAKTAAIMPPPPPPDPQMIMAQAQADALKAESERKEIEIQAKIDNDKTKLEQEGAARSRELDIRETEVTVRERDTSLRESMADTERAKLQAETEAAQAKARLAEAQIQAVISGEAKDELTGAQAELARAKVGHVQVAAMAEGAAAVTGVDKTNAETEKVKAETKQIDKGKGTDDGHNSK